MAISGDIPLNNTACACPKCGYCPHCGRSNAPVHPVHPVYPYPYTTQPFWYGGYPSYTITC